jgi:hypothetical protein
MFCSDQGDQIGRFIRFFRKLQRWPTFLCYSFPKYRLRIKFDRKWIGQHFGQFFSQAHLVTLLLSEQYLSQNMLLLVIPSAVSTKHSRCFEVNFGTRL